MTDDAINWNVLDMFERKSNSLFKNYFLLIAFSLIFIAIILYPFLTSQYKTNSLKELLNMTNGINTNLQQVITNNYTGQQFKTEFNKFYNNSVSKIQAAEIPNYLNSLEIEVLKDMQNNIEHTFIDVNKFYGNQTNNLNKTTSANLRQGLDNLTASLNSQIIIVKNTLDSLTDYGNTFKKNFKDISLPYGGDMFKSFIEFEYVLQFSPIAILVGYMYCYIKYRDLKKLSAYIDKHITMNIKGYVFPFFRPENKIVKTIFVSVPVALCLSLIIINVHFFISPMWKSNTYGYLPLTIFIYSFIGLVFLITIRDIRRPIRIIDTIDISQKFFITNQDLEKTIKDKENKIKQLDTKLHTLTYSYYLPLLISIIVSILIIMISIGLDMNVSYKTIYIFMSLFMMAISIFFVLDAYKSVKGIKQ
jgi:hypothetical protein